MLALQYYRLSRCPGCGGDFEVTTAPENEDRFRAELPIQCYRCVAFSRSHKVYAEEPHSHTLIHQVPHTVS